MNDYMLANEIEVVKPEIRNSAFRQEKTSLDSPVLPGTPVESGSAALDTPQEAVPLAQGRQRWLPKGVENPAMNESAVTPPAAADKAETAATAPATSPEDIPAAKEAPAVESPARPWERKKDPKKHT